MIRKLLILLFAFLVLSSCIFFNLYSFLTPRKPLSNAKILVVDGWLSDIELVEATRLFKSGNYSRVLVPGGKMEHSLFFPGMEHISDVSAVVLMYNGIPPEKIMPVYVSVVKKDRTYQSAQTVKDWLKKNHYENYNINLFTKSTHARRSWFLYKKAFKGECKIGIIAAQPENYDEQKWWTNSNGFRAVVDESIAYLYAFLFFHNNL